MTQNSNEMKDLTVHLRHFERTAYIPANSISKRNIPNPVYRMEIIGNF